MPKPTKREEPREPNNVFAGLPAIPEFMESQRDILDVIPEPYKTIYTLARGYRLAPAEISNRMKIPGARARKFISIAESRANEAFKITKLKNAITTLENLENLLNSSGLEVFHHAATLIEPVRRDLLKAFMDFTTATPTTAPQTDEKRVGLHKKLQEMLDFGNVMVISSAIDILHKGMLQDISEKANANGGDK